MKKMANLLIVFGGGLAAFGISGFGGSFSNDLSHTIAGMTGDSWSGSLGWSLNNQIEIVVGVVSLASGLILRRDSR
jgi:hypothetical protein